MKTISALFLLILGLGTAQAQLGVPNQIVYEPFNEYTLGDDTTSTFLTAPAFPPNYSSSWVITSGAGVCQLRDATPPSPANMLPPVGLRASSTNCLYYTSASVTIQLPVSPVVSSGSAYFSMILYLSGYSTSTANATDYVAGFGEGTLSASTGFEYRLQTKILADGNLVLGLSKGANTVTYSTTEFANPAGTGLSAVFVVGRYNITSASGNGTCDLWINPDPSTFNLAENLVPAPTIAGVGDSVPNLGTGNAEWFYFRGGNYPASHTVDELRIGTTWASVTPQTIPLWGALPVMNPGFDGTNTRAFTYNSVSYNVGDPIPDLSDTSSFGASGLYDSVHGPYITGSSAYVPVWTGSPATGIIFDSLDFNPGQGPTGPGGYISLSDANPRGIFQTLAAVPSVIPYTANTHYILTAQVSSRNPAAANLTFPSTIQVVLDGNGGDLPGTQTFTPPSPGDTSLATFVYNTGATPPTNAVSIVLRASGYVGLAASQAVFDNVTLTVVAIPQITNIQIAGGHVQINFTTANASDLASSFKLLSSSDVTGIPIPYADTGAAITGGSGVFQAMTAVSGPTRFYRIQR